MLKAVRPEPAGDLGCDEHGDLDHAEPGRSLGVTERRSASRATTRSSSNWPASTIEGGEAHRHDGPAAVLRPGGGRDRALVGRAGTRDSRPQSLPPAAAGSRTQRQPSQYYLFDAKHNVNSGRRQPGTPAGRTPQAEGQAAEELDRPCCPAAHDLLLHVNCDERLHRGAEAHGQFLPLEVLPERAETRSPRRRAGSQQRRDQRPGQHAAQRGNAFVQLGFKHEGNAGSGHHAEGGGARSGGRGCSRAGRRERPGDSRAVRPALRDRARQQAQSTPFIDYKQERTGSPEHRRRRDLEHQ